MKKTAKLLAAMLPLLAGVSVQAANTAYYYDRDGITPGGGVANNATYIWNTTDVFWNDIKAGGDAAGLGTITSWLDCAGLGLTPGTLAAAQNTWAAHFSAGTAGFNYAVAIPAGEIRDFFYIVADQDNVTLSGTVRLQGIDTWNSGFTAIDPGSLTFSNLTVLETNCYFIKLTDGGSYNGRINFLPNNNLGYKQWQVGAYTTADFGDLLNNNLIFTANPGGGVIASIFFSGYGDNAIVQGSGLLTLPVGNWYSGPFPNICWNRDGWGNGQGGGFSARGGKLTVNLHGDGRTVKWNPAGARNDLANWFCGAPFGLLLGSYTADSEVEFQNGIDLNGVATKYKLLTPASPNAFATLSGAITDSYGGGTFTKETQNGFQASGTLVLSGANTYRGPTVIQEGKLVITSAHQGGGAVVVSNNATLGVRVTSADTVPISSLMLGSDAASTVEINYCAASANAPITATNFTPSGTTATINVKGRLSVGQIPLVKYSGSILGNGFAGLALGTLPAGVSATLVNNSGNKSVDLNVTAATAVATPSIVNLAVSSASVSLTASNGLPNCGCAVLTSTDVAVPVAGWTTVAAQTFGPSGTFQFSGPGNNAGQQYYILRQQ